MMVTEYQIEMPVSVEEYQVAQLYMVAKLSKQETAGGEGVEVLVNEPFENEELGKGQFTKKIYHLGSRLPGWIKAVMPASALQLHEEAWNAFPYCRTVITCPFFSKLEIKIETWHKEGRANIENVHNLEGKPLKKRNVDKVDIGAPLDNKKNYKQDEDPALFHSQKTGRGPLTPGWQDKSNPVMTIYKLLTVRYEYFGLQGKVENTITGFERGLFLDSHRKLFCWLDEWFGMTMEDIRRMEEETKEQLDERRANSDLKAEGGIGEVE